MSHSTAQRHSDRVGGSSLPLDRCEMTGNEVQREKARRCLIYADMEAKTGRIQLGCLATWPYQPTASEVTAALAEMDAKNDKAHAAERKRVAALKVAALKETA